MPELQSDIFNLKNLKKEGRLMKILTKIFLLCFVLIFLSSCKKDNPEEPKTDITGNYTLSQVNGESLPYLAESTATWNEYLESGSIEFTQSGRFEFELTWKKVNSSGTTHSTDAGDGNYSVNGNSITLVPTSGNQFGGNISNNILTINGGLESGISFTFIKN